MKTVYDMIRELAAFDRDVRKYPIMMVADVNLSVFPEDKVLFVRGKCASESEGFSQTYNVGVAFLNVDISEKQQYNGKKLIPIVQDGKTYYVTQVDLKSTNVKVKCTCYDFRFNFEKPNFDNDALIGHWRRYVRKTTHIPPKNPMGYCGYCKHIHSLIYGLSRLGVCGI